MRTILTIGGSDSSGCSGIQADLRTIAALGGHGASVVTAVTAQSSLAVVAIDEVAPATVAAQLGALLDDLDIAAIKTGMLPSPAASGAIETALRDRPQPLIVDPVLESSTGATLVAASARSALVALFPRAAVVTPNAPELAALSGERADDPSSAEKAARTLVARGARAILVKGGHFADARGTDRLVTSSGVRVFEGPPLDAPHARGTGCMLASAIATLLGTGATLDDAVATARSFVRRAIASGYRVGAGPGPAKASFATAAPRRAAVGRLHVLTDPGRDPIDTAARALAGGADVIQVRDKRDCATNELVAIASAVREQCAAHRATCIVDDRADVAEAAGADGVHLGRDDLDPRAARRLLGPLALVGVTAHDDGELRAALQAPIDYVGVGPVFATTSKRVAADVLGLAGLRELVTASAVPVIAIAGITPERVPEILATGAHGVAVLSGATLSADPERATRAYARAIEQTIGAWR